MAGQQQLPRDPRQDRRTRQFLERQSGAAKELLYQDSIDTDDRGRPGVVVGVEDLILASQIFS